MRIVEETTPELGILAEQIRFAHHVLSDHVILTREQANQIACKLERTVRELGYADASRQRLERMDMYHSSRHAIIAEFYPRQKWRWFPIKIKVFDRKTLRQKWVFAWYDIKRNGLRAFFKNKPWSRYGIQTDYGYITVIHLGIFIIVFGENDALQKKLDEYEASFSPQYF